MCKWPVQSSHCSTVAAEAASRAVTPVPRVLCKPEGLYCDRRNQLYSCRSLGTPSACSIHWGEVGSVSQCPNVPSATMYSLASVTVLLAHLHHHQQVYRSSRLWPPNYHHPIPHTWSEDKHGSSYSHLQLCPCHLFSYVPLRCAWGRGEGSTPAPGWGGRGLFEHDW